MFNHRFVTAALDIPGEKIRYINPDIGGGFGIKNDSYLYLILLALLAKRAGRPVKWVETRSEHLASSLHGNEVFYDAELAVKKDGTILGLKARALHDEGAYMRREPIGAINFIRHATVGYTFQNLSMDIYCVATNKCPVGPNRSYGKMQQCFLVERLIDMAARQLGLDPVEVRLKNFVKPEQMPYETPTGCILDGGDYGAVLQKAVELIDYAKVREEQAEGRKAGKYIGVGFALGMDGCPVNSSIQRMMNPKLKASGDSEAAWVKINPDGQIVAAVGSTPQGQGHETVVSQIVADVLGVHPDDVYAVSGFDSTVNPSTPHSGTYASRFAIVGVGAVLGAALKVREKVLQIAAHLLGDVEVDQLDLEDGRIWRKESKDQSISLDEIARTAWLDLANLPDEIEAGLFGHYVYRAPFKLPVDEKRGNFSLTYSYAVTGAVVEVDVETGKIKILRLVCVDDAGKRLNPLIVEGQIHGAIGHQLGAALYERLLYDEGGQLVTSTFKDYAAPSAADFPKFEVAYVDNPSLATPWGARGAGEGGGSPLIVVSSAVSDALEPFNVEIKSSHLTPEDVLSQLTESPK
jgi:2-furoyl-CoA dehydrogenase large subunit